MKLTRQQKIERGQAHRVIALAEARVAKRGVNSLTAANIVALHDATELIEGSRVFLRCRETVSLSDLIRQTRQLEKDCQAALGETAAVLKEVRGDIQYRVTEVDARAARTTCEALKLAWKRGGFGELFADLSRDAAGAAHGTQDREDLSTSNTPMIQAHSAGMNRSRAI